MKQILCVIGSLAGGGAERQMVELIKILDEHHYKITLITISDNDNYDCPVGVERIKVFGYNRYLKMYKLWKCIRSIKYDCCISFMQRINFISCLATFPCKQGKMICSERNLSLSSTIFEKVLFQLYRRVDFVVPNSCSQAEYIKEHASWLKEKLRTITNYTDIEKNKILDNYCPNCDYIKVGVFARFNYQKNPLYLIEVASVLKKRGFNFEFYWYGHNQLNRNNLNSISSCYLDAKNKIDEYEINDIFHLLPFENDTVKRMNEMDVIAESSLFEGYPNTLSEALACGRAVISSRVSDIPLIVEEGVNGFLFDVKEIESGVQAFIKYASLTLEQRKKMSLANRKKAEKLFNREEFGQKYINLIES